MPTWMPFTAHFRIVPDRTGKRFEHIRDLQKISHLIYRALQDIDGLNLALPGGGQASNYGQWSDLVYGTAVKPQFGETPAQATITGFWDVASVPTPSPAPTYPINAVAPQPQRQLLHAGQWVTGPYNQTPVDTNPNPIISGQVKILVSLLEGAANAGLPDHYMPAEIFRLDYANIIWGDRGQHIPV